MRFSADDRRELLRLISEINGYSKAQAKSFFDVLSPAERPVVLRGLRQQKADLDASPVSVSLGFFGSSSQVIDVQADPAPLPVESPGKRSKPKKVPYTLLLQPEQLEALKSCSESDGETVSYHIRQAIRSYLDELHKRGAGKSH